jgi:plastocyanin
MKKILCYICLIVLVTFVVSCKNASVGPTGATIINNIEVNQDDTVDVEEDNLNDQETEIIEEDNTEVDEIDTKEIVEVQEPIIKEEKVKEILLSYINERMLFVPDKITVKVGETVRWTNKMNYLNKTSEISVYAHIGKLFRSPKLKYDEHFDFVFEKAGSYSYGASPYTALFKKGIVTVE